MRVLAVAVMALCMPMQALALSCAPPDPVRDLLRAGESPDAWVVVHGTLRFDEAELPQGGVLNQTTTPKQTDIPARLTGVGLSATGFDRTMDDPITLRVTCSGPWCGGARDGMRAMAFLKREATGYVWIADACGTRVYSNPDDALLDRITSCVTGGPCTPGPLSQP